MENFHHMLLLHLETKLESTCHTYFRLITCTGICTNQIMCLFGVLTRLDCLELACWNLTLPLRLILPFGLRRAAAASAGLLHQLRFS